MGHPEPRFDEGTHLSCRVDTDPLSCYDPSISKKEGRLFPCVQRDVCMVALSRWAASRNLPRLQEVLTPCSLLIPKASPRFSCVNGIATGRKLTQTQSNPLT